MSKRIVLGLLVTVLAAPVWAQQKMEKVVA